MQLCGWPDGDVIVGGQFNNAGGTPAKFIARWNGTAWSALGSGMDNAVLALATLPNGDIVAGGSFLFAGGVRTNRIARWNGTTWTAIDTQMPIVASINALVTLPDGDLVAGGNFIAPIGCHIARLSTTCPATATPYGAGCASSVGPMALRATALPWVGGTLCTACSSIAATNALVLGVLGASNPSLPLWALHPAGGAGCTLLASLDITLFLAQSQGEATLALMVPVDTSLVGAALLHQALQFDLDAQFQITRFTSSNGLTLTVGMF